MQIEICQRQRDFRLDRRALLRFLRFVMARVAELDPARDWRELSVILTDDRIRELNREWFDADCVTDVISFAYPPAGGLPGDSGEVVVNVRRAQEEGAAREGADRELALYLAHGCHHLSGAEDDSPQKKKEMLALEMLWLQEAEARGCLEPFFT